MEHAIKK